MQTNIDIYIHISIDTNTQIPTHITHRIIHKYLHIRCGALYRGSAADDIHLVLDDDLPDRLVVGVPFAL